jgi:hypothetical protein
LAITYIAFMKDLLSGKESKSSKTSGHNVSGTAAYGSGHPGYGYGEFGTPLAGAGGPMGDEKGGGGGPGLPTAFGTPTYFEGGQLQTGFPAAIYPPPPFIDY